MACLHSSRYAPWYYIACQQCLKFSYFFVIWIMTGELMHTTSNGGSSTWSKGYMPPFLLMWSSYILWMTLVMNSRDHKEVCMAHKIVSPKPSFRQRWTILVRTKKALKLTWKMHYMHCSIPKGTSQAEMMSNSEKTQAHSFSCYQITKATVSQAVNRNIL